MILVVREESEYHGDHLVLQRLILAAMALANVSNGRHNEMQIRNNRSS